jgi:hypothetical protein
VAFGWQYAPPELLEAPFGEANALPTFAEGLFGNKKRKNETERLAPERLRA